MKIDLTKDEWEFLKESLTDYINMNRGSNYYHSREDYFYKIYQLLEKLGSEWVDDE